MVSSLRSGLQIFCGTWLRCNSLQWNSAPERCPRGPAKRGSGSGGNARPRLWYVGARIPLRGRIFLRKVLLSPAWSHSASLRLALHPQKPHTSPCPTAGLRLNKNHDVTRPRVTEDQFAGGCHGRHICDHRQQELSEAAQLLSLSLLRWGRNCFSEP
jgi:hypothetical protein